MNQPVDVMRNILLVDDEETVLSLVKTVIEESGRYSVHTTNDPTKVIEILEWHDIDLVISDLQMPELDGEAVARMVRDYDENIPIIIFTGQGNRQLKMRLLEAGAWDFITKGHGDPDSLIIAIDKAFALLERKRSKPRRLIAKDRQMKKVFSMVKKVAEVPSTVLIQGEPGTGKELIAHEVHQKRNEFLRKQDGNFSEKDHPYLAVNCGALSRTLLESQLFGHKKGAFTGSVSDQDGVFVAARKGTLFLDEITELDLDLQVKLLRALQEREVTPVGSTVAVPVKARVVTATNRPIQNLVRDEKFRADLYYRINVVSIEIPPLRSRRSDIQPLAQHFLKEVSRAYNCQSRELTQESIRLLELYSWPGNVRELHNVIERSFALGEDPAQITPVDLPEQIRRENGIEGRLAGFGAAAKEAAQGLAEEIRFGSLGDGFPTYDELVAEHIRLALRRTRGIKSRAANLLSIDRNRLYRLMGKYKINAESARSD
ncbi:MAG: sigma-54 dependent transcriptional regulator [Planctomycetota bacterium]|nr:sigma-54 dependent transcriptional regulator [Planctomycetota bacterium]